MSAKVYTKNLEKDILKYLKTFSKAYAQEASKQFTQQAKTCIEMFYKDYTPNYYDKTFDLLNSSYAPYFNDNGKSYCGGVRITSLFITQHLSSGYTNNTYTSTQLAWHRLNDDPTGYNENFTHIRTISPLTVLTNMVKDKSFLYSIYGCAEKIAIKQNYKYLNIRR